MLLQSQTQFAEDFIRPLAKGEDRKLPPGYDQFYEGWREINEELIPKLSVEERTKSFIAFVDEKVTKEIDKLIPHETLVDEKNRKLNARGQVVLASEDNGVHFDKILKPEDVQTKDPTKYTFLSPTLRSTTTDIREVINEQTMLHAVAKLEEQHFLVSDTNIVAGKILIEVRNPKGTELTVQIDPAQKFDQPLNYVFINKSGLATSVPETQLPESFGEPKEDPTLRTPTETEQRISSLQNDNYIKNAAMGAGLIPAFMQKPQAQPTLAIPQIKMPKLNIPKIPHLNAQPTEFSNVMSSKKRFQEKKKIDEESQMRERERFEKSKEEYDKNRQLKIEKQKKEQEEKRRASGKKQASAAGAGIASIIAGTTAGVTGLTTFISTIVD